MQYRGGRGGDDYDDYVFKIQVGGGKVDQYNLVNNVVGLFNTATVLAGSQALSVGMASPAGKAYQGIAQTLTNGLSAAGTYNFGNSLNIPLSALGGKDQQRMVIAIPDMFGGSQQSSLEFSVKRIGSIILSNKNGSSMTDSDIINDYAGLSPRSACKNPQERAQNACSLPVDPLRVFFVKNLYGVEFVTLGWKGRN